MRRVVNILACLALACGADGDEAVVGEVLVFVDTDMPVPAFVSRLRVDLYTDEGRWYATRDVSLARPSDWPTSFGVHTPDASRAVVIRLRGYPEGGVRDYRGERFEPRPSPAPAPLGLEEPAPALPSGEPRLRDASGVDVTPEGEPLPLLTIDRLVRLEATSARRASTRVLLAGACVGTMADVAGRRTCVGTEAALEPLVLSALEDRRSPEPSRQGSFDHARPCTVAPRPPTSLPDGTPLYDEERCVPGAMFRLGTRDGAFGEADNLPERIAILEPFLVARFEVTVARWRKALAAGFVSPDASPTAHDAPLTPAPTGADDTRVCSFSTSPIGREAYAVSCVSWQAARAFCRHEGGDLLSEAEWEYAALVAARPRRTRFPWGGPDDELPSCDQAVWGRGERQFSGQACTSSGIGPLPVAARVDRDATPELGIVSFGGGLAEWTRDAFAKMSATCWASSSLREPGCDVAGAPSHTLRGGAWRDNVAGLIGANRRAEPATSASVGFRCMRRGAP